MVHDYKHPLAGRAMVIKRGTYAGRIVTVVDWTDRTWPYLTDWQTSIIANNYRVVRDYTIRSIQKGDAFGQRPADVVVVVSESDGDILLHDSELTYPWVDGPQF